MSKFGVFMWEPCLSPHKIDLFEALGRSPRISSICYIAQEGLPLERKALGWSLPEALTGHFIIEPSETRVDELIANSPPEAVHIFSGIHSPPCIVQGIAAAIRHKKRFGIMSEPRAFDGAKGWLRFAHSWATEGEVRRNVDFVLAIGRHGPPWFASVGYDRTKIFPFAYFLPLKEAPRKQRAGPQQVNYLGRLTSRKGFDLLLDALPLLRNEIKCEIAGAGCGEARVGAVRLRTGKAPLYRGVLPMDEVPDFLAQTDILVAPSIVKDDGWNAVISEALLQGAAVVTTDRVGASICLDAAWRGRVISKLTPAELAGAIDNVIDRDQLDDGSRQRRALWARNRLTGEAGARCLLETLSFVYNSAPRPEPFYAD